MIHYITGDATLPVVKPALIMHVCNDIGGWGRGFVLALSKRWPEPENMYRSITNRALGDIQVVSVGGEILVANMIAQRGVMPGINGRPPIRYESLAECLKQVDILASTYRGSIHAPRIGCGLAGGSWSVVGPLVEHYLRDRDVYIYDLPEAT